MKSRHASGENRGKLAARLGMPQPISREEPGLEFTPLRVWRNLGRTREIVTVLLNHGFGDVIDRTHLRKYLRWWSRVVLRKRTETSPHVLTRAERIRLALEELGPTFVKFGQVVSTRPDLVPEAVVCELKKLQERVPPFAGREAVAIVERELGGPVSKLFFEFDPTPIAAGSLGQVHRARHQDGTLLAVKIRRPNVIRDIERDLSLMSRLAVLIERHMPEAQVFDPVGLVNQFARSIRREVDFTREGRTVDEFRRLFRSDATLHVPRVFWELSTEAVLTMEFVEGYAVDGAESLRLAGLSPQGVACNGARIFLKMAFQHGLFHGDPHPGNIRILPQGVIALLDYGMVGRLDEDKREQLIDLLLAVTHGDARLCAEQLLLVGKPSRSVDRALLESDVRDFIQAYYGQPLDRISIGHLLSDFVSILANHGIRYPADLMLLIRAIVTLEGVGRQLDPGFNLAPHLAPVVENLVRERYNPRRLAGRLFDDAQRFAGMLRNIPGQIGRTLEKLANDELEVHVEHRSLDRLITEVDRSSNRLVVGLVMSSLILASALVIRQSTVDALWISIPAFVLSSLLGIWLIFGVFRSGRL